MKIDEQLEIVLTKTLFEHFKSLSREDLLKIDWIKTKPFS